MGLGWTGSAPNGLMEVMKDALRQKYADQARADALTQQGFNNRNVLADNARQDAMGQLNAKLREDALAEQASQHAATEADKTRDYGLKLGDAIPGDTFIPGNDPIASAIPAGLKHEAPARPAMGDAFVGPMPGDAGGAETPQQAIIGRVRGIIKDPSAKQIDTQTDNNRAAASERRAEQAQRSTEGYQRGMLRVAEKNATTNANKPQTVSTVTIQTVDDQGKPVTRVVPKSEAVGQSYARPASAATLARVDSAEAVKQTGDDIIQHLADPKVAAMIGPAMGRYNTLRDFVGDPPPEMAELAGMIESFALANMGVHGMRSVQGAKKITELLDKRHTPESLAAAIKGLGGFSSHFMENQGRTQKASTAGGTVSMVAPDGRALQVPADKVAEMESHGAKRQ